MLLSIVNLNESIIFCTVGKSELNCDGEFSYWIKYALFPTIVPVSSPLKFSPPSVYEYITLYAGDPARVMPLSVVSLAVKFFRSVLSSDTESDTYCFRFSPESTLSTNTSNVAEELVSLGENVAMSVLESPLLSFPPPGLELQLAGY